MKSTFLVILFFLIISCNPDKSDDQTQQDFSLIVPNFRIENPKVISVVKEYIKDNGGEPHRVYTMLVQRQNLITTSFQLSAIATYSELDELTPSGYFMVDDDVILVYTGLENLSKGELFIKQMKDVIGDKLEDNQAMIFDPSTWEVKMVRDSVIVERGVINLLGPPVVEAIKFLPPKVK